MIINGLYDRTETPVPSIGEYVSQLMTSDGDPSGAFAEIFEVTAAIEEDTFVQDIRRVANYSLGFTIALRIPKESLNQGQAINDFIKNIYNYLWSETIIIDPNFFYQDNPGKWDVVSTMDLPKVSVCKAAIHDQTISIVIVVPHFLEGNNFSFLTGKRIQTRLYGALTE